MSFVTVLFADNKEELFNINCRNVNFLHCIRVKCAEVCGITDVVDVADENGECKFLFRNLDGYTSQFVGERDKLILLKVEDVKPGEKLANNCRLTPLLKSLEDDKDFIAAINPAAGQKSKTNKVNTKLSVKKALGTSNTSNNLTPGQGNASVSPSPTPAQGAAGKRASVIKL